jgi:iron complex transport system substrate-binding protein
VVIFYDPGNFASQLRQLGIKVVNEPAAKNLRQAYRQILDLGRLTGHVRGARAVVHSMRTQLAAIVRSVPKTRRHLRVYHELDPTYYSATSSTFIGSIYKLFGFRDIADGAGGTGGGYPQLSAEYIIAKNPQIIVLADTRCCGQNYATVAARPGWGTISAVQHHRVVLANDDVASRWGPRIVQFARTVARIAKQG